LEAEYRVLRPNVKANLYNGIAWSIGYNFVMPFTGVMAQQMGATNTQYALLSSMPALLTIIITLPAAFIIEQFKHQKRIVSWIILFSRLCYLLMALVPLFNFGQVNILIYLIGIYTATNSIINVAYQSMVGEIIPAKFRNRVFAQRNMWIGASGMVVALVAGWGIDRITYPYGYQIAYAFGFAAALFETWYFAKLRIPSEEKNIVPLVAGPTRPVRVLLAEKLKLFLSSWNIRAGKPFYLFCASAVVYIFAWQAGWPIYLKVKVDTLQANNLWISIDTVAGSLGSLLGFRPWARFADKKGNGYAIFVSSLCLALTPFLWIYIPSMYWAVGYDFIGGIITAGFTQSVFNRLLEIVRSESRQRAIAIYTSLTQVSAIFAPIVGMKVYELLPYGPTMATIGTARIIGACCFLLVISSWFQKYVSRK
jgi:MFS family permease